MAAKQHGDSPVLESVYSVIALVFVLVACVELCGAATVVDVYRLIQYDISGVPFGSRLAGLNHHASSLHFPPGADLSRAVLVIPVRDLNLSYVKDYLSERQPLGGLLFLLPQIFNFESKESTGDGEEPLKNVVMELEQLLIHTNIPLMRLREESLSDPCWKIFLPEDRVIFFTALSPRECPRDNFYPVYFAFENDDINTVLADIKRNDVSGQPATATTGGYKLVVSTTEPKKVASPVMSNIQGWLPGLKADGDPNQLPTIAIVASYDTFGAAPALSVGSDSNGSGVVALLEIARLFSLLYSNPKTRGRYNLLFGLTSGGPYNYNGTHKWLRSFDQRLRETIDYAICLNSIGSWNNELWIHVSKPPENAYIKQAFEGLSNVGEELGIKVGLKHKKINISNSRVAWEHEQFSRQRITAATLSEISTAPGLFENTGSLADRRNFVNDDAVIKSVKLVAESLARQIYGHEGKNIQIFADEGSLAVNPSYIRSWLDLLSRTARVAPFLSKNDPFVMALKKELEEHTEEVILQNEVLDGMFTFYDSTKATLNIYQVASVTFDLLLLLVLGSYLIVLFSFLVITTRGLDDLISLFRRPPSRKVKTA